MTESRIRVILVDDHPAVRAGIRQFIERDPTIEVLAEGNDGVEALDLIRQYDPDIAVVDLQMPRRPGTYGTRATSRSRRGFYCAICL